ncbi:MAG: hypothetical protein K0M69_01850 [Youngiibacter sp.]|nr:hypothetical protein [Youngiibacter sp.]
MKGDDQLENNKVSTAKAASITALSLLSLVIMVLGAYYIVHSTTNGITIKVINASVPGSVFGLLVLYLGFKYWISVRKLRTEVYKMSSSFSIKNFSRNKQ